MKCHSSLYIFCLLLLLSFSMFAKCEFFTSISEMETLLQTEGELAKTLDRYLEAEEKRLERLRRLSKAYKKMYDSAVGDPEDFLSNPVHAYLLLKHLTTDWNAACQLIDETSTSVFEHLPSLVFPGDEDLNGAATALIRLQETYLLNSTRIASGDLGGSAKSWQLSAGDCYELGYQAFIDYDYHYSDLWMQEALKRLPEEEEVPTADKVSVLGHLAYSRYMLGNARDAKEITEQILDEDPAYMPAYQSLAYLEQYMRDVESGRAPDIGEETRAKTFRFNKNAFLDRYEEYERLCRGENMQSLETQSKLHCRVSSFNNSYLLLQPIREEELSLDPRIVMYHDVIADRDVDTLKQLAIPKLKRASVVSANTGQSKASHNRISKSAWLREEEHPAVKRSSRMISAITGLALSSAEELHVINYGIGGHYEPHYDFRREGEVDTFSPLGIGNRIATWIYYLSDVKAGGFTVFPDIGVQVKPRKGSAAFWLNLKRNGEGDLNTKHAACPVLTGSKWVANKWIHETDNEFRMKCSLDKDK